VLILILPRHDGAAVRGSCVRVATRISEIVETQFGFHIIKLEKYTAAE
jgi:hypothetical protein